MRLVASVALALAAAGCGLRTPAFTTPPPEERPDLERRVAVDPTDVAAAVALAAVYVADGRLDDARVLLERTNERAGSDRTVGLVLGVVAQELGLFAEARDRYLAYLHTDPAGPLSRHVQARVDAIEGAVRRGEAALLLAEGAPSEPTRDRVVVLPFAYQAGDTIARQRATAIADVIAQRMSRAHGEVVRAADVRALLEVSGTSAGDLALLSRGREIADAVGAEHVIQGDLRGSTADLTSVAVLISSNIDGRLRVRSFTESAPFDLSVGLTTRIASRALSSLDLPFGGSALAQTIARHPLRQAVALAPFGRGLDATARSDHQGALEAFIEARGLDPTSEAATVAAVRAELLIATLDTPAGSTVEAAERLGGLQRAVAALLGRPGSAHAGALDGLAADDRVPLSEVLAGDRLGLNGLLDLTFTIPGSGR